MASAHGPGRSPGPTSRPSSGSGPRRSSAPRVNLLVFFADPKKVTGVEGEQENG